MHNDESHPQQPSQAAGGEPKGLKKRLETLRLIVETTVHWAPAVRRESAQVINDAIAALSRPPAPPEGARVPAVLSELVEAVRRLLPQVYGMRGNDHSFSWKTLNQECTAVEAILKRAASPEAAEAGGWLPWDSKNPPEGTYWLRMETPDVDCDVDDDGRMVGRYTDETCVEYAVATVSIGPDGETELDAVQRWDLGEIPELCWVTHYAEVKRPEFLPSPPPADEETGK